MKRESFGCEDGRGKQVSMRENQDLPAQIRVWTTNHLSSRNLTGHKGDGASAFEIRHPFVSVGLLLLLSFGLVAWPEGAAQSQPVADRDPTSNGWTPPAWIDFHNEDPYMKLFAQRATETSTVITTASSARSVSLAVFLPGMWISDILMADNNVYSSLIVPGGGTLEIGKPDIPALGQWVLVPNGTDLSVSVSPGEPIVFDNIDVPPVQPPELDFPGATRPEFAKDEVIYSSNAEYPGTFVEVEPIRDIRGQDCTIVWLYPYQYNPGTRRLSVYKDVVVDVGFEGKIQPALEHLQSGDFEKMLKRLAVNAEMVLSTHRQLPILAIASVISSAPGGC